MSARQSKCGLTKRRLTSTPTTPRQSAIHAQKTAAKPSRTGTHISACGRVAAVGRLLRPT